MEGNVSIFFKAWNFSRAGKGLFQIPQLLQTSKTVYEPCITIIIMIIITKTVIIKVEIFIASCLWLKMLFNKN